MMGKHMSNETNPGCLGYVGDEKLPSYMGTIINHYFRIPLLSNQDSMESIRFFFVVFFHGSHIRSLKLTVRT